MMTRQLWIPLNILKAYFSSEISFDDQSFSSIDIRRKKEKLEEKQLFGKTITAFASNRFSK